MKNQLEAPANLKGQQVESGIIINIPVILIDVLLD